nr:hypothetical protein [Pandoravirus aubagnensis]
MPPASRASTAGAVSVVATTAAIRRYLFFPLYVNEVDGATLSLSLSLLSLGLSSLVAALACCRCKVPADDATDRWSAGALGRWSLMSATYVSDARNGKEVEKRERQRLHAFVLLSGAALGEERHGQSLLGRHHLFFPSLARVLPCRRPSPTRRPAQHTKGDATKWDRAAYKSRH